MNQFSDNSHNVLTTDIEHPVTRQIFTVDNTSLSRFLQREGKPNSRRQAMTKQEQKNLVKKLCSPRDMMYVQRESVVELIQDWFLMNFKPKNNLALVTMY